MATAAALCFLFLNIFLTVDCAPDVQLTSGKVQGVDSQAQTSNRLYYTYYGIPFAQPPVGDLRFRRPQPFQGGNPNTVISSSNFKAACIQPIFEENYPMSEDCLYLNVFTPVSTSPAKKVMLWVYGGGFTFGDAYGYTPSRMVTEYDVIVVTFHYRLNVFGFLSAGNDDGNYGLYDQLAALQWVKDNIGQFGGDADDVTVFGESAGSASVSFLSLSPRTNGLFTKGIMQSGTATSPWALKQRSDAGRQFDQLVRAAKCDPWIYFPLARKWFYDSIMRCLRSLDLDTLGVATVEYMSGSDQHPAVLEGEVKSLATVFLPVVDGDIVPKDPRLLMSDKKYLASNGVLDRKYVLGYTNAEGLGGMDGFVHKADAAALAQLDTVDNARRYMQAMADAHFPFSGVPKSAMSLLEYQYTYPRKDGRVRDFMGLLNVNKDVFYALPTLEMVNALTSASPTTDVFVYLFDHYPQLVNPADGIYGTSHAMDLLYEFDYTDGLAQTWSYYAKIPADNNEDLALFDVFPGALTQFAKTGNPSRGNGQSPSSWPRYDHTGQSYMAISAQPEVRQYLDVKRVQLWTDVIPDALKQRPLRNLFG